MMNMHSSWTQCGEGCVVCLCRVEGGVTVNKVSYAAIMQVITQHFSPKYGKGVLHDDTRKRLRRGVLCDDP